MNGQSKDSNIYCEALNYAGHSVEDFERIYVLLQIKTLEGMDKKELNQVIADVRKAMIQPWFDLNSIVSNGEEIIATLISQAEVEIYRLDHPKPDTSGYVYLVKSNDHKNLYKIGRTGSPDDRMHTFNVKLPFRVRYECLIETDDMFTLERRLHAHFSNKRMGGEFFRLNHVDVAFFHALESGVSLEHLIDGTYPMQEIETLPLFNKKDES